MRLTPALRAAAHRVVRQSPPSSGSRLTVRGELDYYTVDQLCRDLERHLDAHRHITVDLTGATFYDQAAVDALTSTQERALRAGCRITLTKPPARADLRATA
ncbi:STAS domain-containing protein [Streptacidiphilus melanogenes]|uniref:STAS domain-containing protein n=1 Tax=Streptacidiphilus melanogenes TaxID=411235 RepID=UPI0005A6002F|nr:STAS domain-containing protein [Streptacidiphilus melanogenes]